MKTTLASTTRNRPAASKSPVPPEALVLAGALTVQFGAAIATTLFDELGPAGTTLVRLVFSAVVLVVFWRPSLRPLDRTHLPLLVVFGLALGSMNLMFYEALDRIPLGVAVTVEFIGPLSVGVLGSRRAVDFALAALAAVGIVLLADPGGGRIELAGVLFALGAGACWATYIVLSQRVGRHYSGGRGLALASIVALLVPLGPGIAGAGGALLHPGALAAGLAVAILSSSIPYSLDTAALRRLPASTFGVLMSLEPAVAALAGLILLGQGLSAVDVLAIGCVVLASIGVSRRARAPRASVPAA